MARPLQQVQVYSIQKKAKSDRIKRPYVVRYSIDGRQRSRSFPTRAEADRYRSELVRAVRVGEVFDEVTGEPAAWQLPLSDVHVHEWARRWLASQWEEWQPRTRTSAIDAVARLAALAVRPRSTPPPDLRVYLTCTMPPGSEAEQDATTERWLQRNGLRLADLDRVTAAELDRGLGLRVDGTTPLAPNTAKRFRTTAHACVLAAVDAGALPADPWPKRTRTRASRKVVRTTRKIDIRALPNPEQMAAALAAIRNHQPGSRTYQVMTSVAYYAGLRPSEVVMLRVRSLTLPAEGWGRIDVTEADVAFDEPGEPKTGTRSVPIPPVLVEILARWLHDNGLTDPDQLLFRTRTGGRPSTTNWNRAWKRATASVGLPPLRVYDCRHAAATTWLRAGVPLGDTARRLGHSVETLVSTYVGALEGDEELGNARIESALTQEREQRRTA